VAFCGALKKNGRYRLTAARKTALSVTRYRSEKRPDEAAPRDRGCNAEALQVGQANLEQNQENLPETAL
jgi:hypothetical protein